MALSKIMNENEWPLAAVSASAVATVSIHFAWPANDQLYDFAPEKRIGAIDDLMRGHINQVVSSGLLQSYTVVMVERRRPRSLQAEIFVENLPALSKLPGVDRIAITKVAGFKKKRPRPTNKLKFHCVKMTVAIQIEGAEGGLQKYEERYVLLKAVSCEDAYQRLEATRADYAQPYLNSDGYFVRWRIESLDDCYETGIETAAEFNSPHGVEVFSILKNRKLTPERTWDGK
ncbi:DUF4288 domain-containing protein [Hymenobacter chitinivorans]|uniref:Uncharacterized protein DUF4288 n=1 Tax=Hymenobacter chitinivorans DSM 11115 TaxID=1121954 RepID=A0A2M9BM57_9BACT|nr:DUF4288 domain-containing protein [Hymenobacter chitinivorans]PJJ59021.1 uncharacterized protein DUF4288 [Hymenobacter chitinivorans DSM 11115]